MVVLTWSSMWRMDSFSTHKHTYTGTQTWRDLHVLVFYLCLQTYTRNRQCSAVVWDPALTLCCCILCVLEMHHPRHYMTHSSVHREASPPAHSCCFSPETLCLHAVCFSDSLFEKRGHPFPPVVIKLSVGEMVCSCRANTGWHAHAHIHTHKHAFSPSVQCALGVARS